MARSSGRTRSQGSTDHEKVNRINVFISTKAGQLVCSNSTDKKNFSFANKTFELAHSSRKKIDNVKKNVNDDKIKLKAKHQ